MVEHKIQIDKYITVLIEIPMEINIMEFKALTMKVNKLFNISEINIPTNSNIKNKNNKYFISDEEKENFIKRYYECDDKNELAKELGITLQQLMSKLTYYKKSIKNKNVINKKNKKNKYIFTNDDIEIIKKEYKNNTPRRKIAEKLNKTERAIFDKIYAMRKKGEL